MTSAGRLSIDLGAIVANWRRLAEEAASAECAAVVKADAYGLGLAQVGPALAAAGCRAFFVATLGEAIALRGVASDAMIYVLNGLSPGEGGAFLAHGLRPVLGSRDEVEEWRSLARQQRVAAPAALHVDTGMNRLGMPASEFAALINDTPPGRLGFEPALLMSHFVASDDEASPRNARQIAAFAAARALCPEVPASLANSSGIFLGGAAHHDLVRPGYALYGGNPRPGRENPMRPVVRLAVPVLQLRSIAAGETVGYDAQWTAQAPRRIATLALGYADGYPRAATATDAKRARAEPAGMAIIAGRRCPFAGRVSMDLVTVDVTELDERAVRRGDEAVLIGEGLTLDEVGARAGTIGYEVLTHLGRRFERAYS